MLASMCDEVQTAVAVINSRSGDQEQRRPCSGYGRIFSGDLGRINNSDGTDKHRAGWRMSSFDGN